MTEKRAHELFNKWVERLKLHEWDIRFHWKVDPKRLAIPESAGCASYNSVCLQAVIEIGDLDMYEAEMKDFEVDYEQVLVHELLHLKFALIYDTGERAHEEAAHRLIDQLAHALVQARREVPQC